MIDDNSVHPGYILTNSTGPTNIELFLKPSKCKFERTRVDWKHSHHHHYYKGPQQ